MDEAVAVLTGFPLPSPFPNDEFYDEAVHTHIKKIEQLLSRKKDAVSGDSGVQILKVGQVPENSSICSWLSSICNSCLTPPSTPSPTFSYSTRCKIMTTSPFRKERELS